MSRAGYTFQIKIRVMDWSLCKKYSRFRFDFFCNLWECAPIQYNLEYLNFCNLSLCMIYAHCLMHAFIFILCSEVAPLIPIFISRRILKHFYLYSKYLFVVRLFFLPWSFFFHWTQAFFLYGFSYQDISCKDQEKVQCVIWI
jgi:hypothetical protein